MHSYRPGSHGWSVFYQFTTGWYLARGILTQLEAIRLSGLQQISITYVTKLPLFLRPYREGLALRFLPWWDRSGDQGWGKRGQFSTRLHCRMDRESEPGAVIDRDNFYSSGYSPSSMRSRYVTTITPSRLMSHSLTVLARVSLSQCLTLSVSHSLTVPTNAGSSLAPQSSPVAAPEIWNQTTSGRFGFVSYN